MKFCWTTLHVNNMEESFDFYTRIVGLEVDSRLKPNESYEIVFLGSQETKIELICDSKEGKKEYGKDISIGFEVRSLDDTIQILREESIEIVEGPVQPNPKTRFIIALDPNGMRIQFVERNL